VVKNFDTIIVGAGPAGLFAAYYMAEQSDAKILVIEKGNAVSARKCPINETGACARCKPCHILSGVGGAGLFSDGKLNFIPKLGKTDLTQFMDMGAAQTLIDETESILNRFGMNGPSFPTDMHAARRLRRQAKIHGVDLMIIRQKHLGSDCLPAHILELSEHIRQRGVSIHTSEEVIDVRVENGRVKGVETDRKFYPTRNVILAPGRVGARWMSALAVKHHIGLTQRGIEVGVRVEVHNEIFQDLCEVIYDPVFFVQTEKYDDQTRTFCTNWGGFVSQENYSDFVCVNGHALRHIKSENTNFAFLSKVVLTEPVTDNQAYGESIGSLATLIGAGKPILQRFGDLKRGRRSTWRRIRNSTINPTFTDVVCGDIAMALPERILANILEGLEKLNYVVPGVANAETLLYAPEIKFFATQVQTDSNLETPIRGMYVAGDGPGVAGNIVSSAATGLLSAKAVVKKLH